MLKSLPILCKSFLVVMLFVSVNASAQSDVYAYVANSASSNVSVINTATNSVVATIPVGTTPLSFGNFIRLASSTALPIDFAAVKAYEQGNSGIQVAWDVATESDALSYEVEKSINGTSFIKAATLLPKANDHTSVSYQWLDAAPVRGNNFYRIKGIEVSGKVVYSAIVKVNISKGNSSITAYPNPIKGRQLNIQFINQPSGRYKAILSNGLGQVVYQTELQHNGGSATLPFHLTHKLAKGRYQLQITNKASSTILPIIVE